MYGRHGEAPLPIVACYSPVHCFHAAIEAARIALKYRTPVILLSDGYLANGSEPWRLPDVDDLPDISVPFQTELNGVDRDGNHVFWPYLRDPDTLARPWAIPGTPGLMHRIGGLEKADGTGNVNYTPGEPRQDGGAARRQDRADRRRPSGARDPRRSRCRNVLAGLGIDVGRDRRRHAASPPCRPQDRVDPPHPPQSAPERPRREAEPVPPRAGARAQQRSADAASCAASTWSTPRPLTKIVGLPFVAREIEAEIERILEGMTDAAVNLTSKKDWASDQEVRWCPGCGDYGILLAVQQLMPELGVLPENTVFISGIGCSSRFPYYMNTYGMHSIHGRAPAIATGVAVARPDLDVWVITGDGDGLSIGGNHLIHALRRNVNLKILLFNNRIYGLTKGQYSPTSEVGKVTKSTPFGSSIRRSTRSRWRLGAEASFVARTHDLDRQHMIDVFRAAHDHRGSSFVEIYQNCNVFNDHQFDDITKRSVRDEMMIDLVHGRADPLRRRRPPRRGDGQRRPAAARRGRRRRRGRTARARRASPGAVARVRTRPAQLRRPLPHAVRHLPPVRAPGVRQRGRRPARRRRPSARVPATSPTSCARTAPGTSTDVRQPIRVDSSAGAEDPPFLVLDARSIVEWMGGSNQASSSPLRSAAASTATVWVTCEASLTTSDGVRRGEPARPHLRQHDGVRTFGGGTQPRPVVNGQTSTRCGHASAAATPAPGSPSAPDRRRCRRTTVATPRTGASRRHGARRSHMRYSASGPRERGLRARGVVAVAVTPGNPRTVRLARRADR